MISNVSIVNRAPVIKDLGALKPSRNGSVQSSSASIPEQTNSTASGEAPLGLPNEIPDGWDHLEDADDERPEMLLFLPPNDLECDEALVGEELATEAVWAKI